MNALQSYFQTVMTLLQKTSETQEAVMEQAAQICIQSLQNNKLLYTFGTGHSHMLAEEIFYRAGGLVRVYPILDEALMLHGGAVKSTAMERLEGYGETLAKHFEFEAGDVLFIFSNSGRNAAGVEMAIAAKSRGVFVIAVTSLAHSRVVSSRHSSEKKLYELADLVIDNGGSIGDAAVSIGGRKVGPTSTVIGAAILQSIVCRIVELAEENGANIEVFTSSNIEGGDHVNRKYIQQFGKRIRPLW